MDKILITGSSDGIGKQAALRLAGRGNFIIIHGRDRKKCLRVYQQISKYFPYHNCDFIVADLSSQKQIREMAKKIIQYHSDLNIIINNAGAYYPKRAITEDGVEKNLAVNYLSRFLLTNLLLNSSKLNALTRIINVAGASHKKGKINFDDINMEEKYSMSKAIRQAKLADVLFTFSLAKRLKGKNISVNCLHPGAVKTNALKKAEKVPFLIKTTAWLFKPLFKNPKKGADTLVYLATTEELNDQTGRYFVKTAPAKSAPITEEKETQDKLWALSNELVGENF